MNKRHIFAIGVVVLLVGAATFDNVLRHMKGGALISRGNTSASTDPITASPAGLIDFAFPADGGCQLSPAALGSCTRCRVGDACTVGLSAHATSIVGTSADPTCYVDSNLNVRVSKCPGSSTTASIVDAGYRWRTFSVETQ